MKVAQINEKYGANIHLLLNLRASSSFATTMTDVQTTQFEQQRETEIEIEKHGMLTINLAPHAL